MKWIKYLAITLGTFLVLTELGLRAIGVIDFPLYHADASIGYIPKPSQKGSFLRKNDWAFNSISMAGPEFNGRSDDGVRDVLLIGDSIVYGGNAYRASERLGATLQANSDFRVWSIAAGSWSLQNELTWLNAHPEVVRNVDNIVFVLNSGDLAPASSWGCSWTHPREAPVSAVWYTFAKYVLKPPCEGTSASLQVPPRDAVAMLKEFVQAAPAHVRISAFLYPDRGESASDDEMPDGLGKVLGPLMTARLAQVVSIKREALWGHCADCYRDNIHPTPEANLKLAQIIAKSLVR